MELPVHVDNEVTLVAPFEEILISNVYAQEALVNVLERKGLLTRKEVLEEIISLRKRAIKKS